MRRYLLRVWCAALLIGFTSAFAGQPPLRVMTYNIRYDNPADSLDNWKYRRDFVANLIHYHAPDILGTQEGLVNQLRDMSARLPEYAHSGKGRDDGRAGGEHCAIF